MTTATQPQSTSTRPQSTSTIREQLADHRIFYHNIEVAPGVHTRFEADYDDVSYLRNVDHQQTELASLIEQHTPEGFSGRRVLDAGCADGLFTFHAARRGAQHVLGVERNAHNYRRACLVKEVGGFENVAFRHGAIEDIPRDDAFHDVIALGLLYHVISPLNVLHALRSVCTDRLMTNIPIQHTDDNSVPLMRLDRYQGPGHGFWAFNEKMVYQMLETSGFEIEHVEVTHRCDDESPAQLFIIARPASSSSHHIFEAVIDQEFPPSIRMRRDAVRAVWPQLAERFSGPVAIFGAGKHTPWLLDATSDLTGPRIAAILDDRAPVSQHPASDNEVSSEGRIANIPVIRPSSVDADRFDAILISSWFQHDAILARCRDLYGDRIPLICLTSDLSTTRPVHDDPPGTVNRTGLSTHQKL